MSEAITVFLTLVASMLFAAAVAMVVLGIYQTVLARLITDIQVDSEGGFGLSVLVRKLGALNQGLVFGEYETWVRRLLVKGGQPYGYEPRDILSLQELTGLASLLIGLVACSSLQASLFWALAIAALGFFYPLVWVKDQVKKRHFLVSRALPYNLDLLTLSVEAGMDFTAALAKVAEKGKGGPLRDEFLLVLRQLKLGKTREEALKNMSDRVDYQPLSTFISSLLQADRMGTSLGKVLRLQSTQMRVDRTQRAEKLAAQAPVKMLFPLVACIFPTVFMVLFGPIIFSVMFGNLGR